VRLGETAQDQHRQFGRTGADGSQRVHTALLGHGKVHHQHVDQAFADNVQGFAPVGRFSHDLQVDLLGEVLAQACANQRVIVDDGNFDHVGIGRFVNFFTNHSRCMERNRA